MSARQGPLRVVVISDRSHWTDLVIEACDRADLIFERWPWREAAGLEPIPDAIVVDAAGEFPERISLLELWARKTWQPVCIVSVAPEPGAAHFGSTLQRRGYLHMLSATARPAFRARLRHLLKRVLAAEMRLVTALAAELGWSDPDVVRALSTAMLIFPRFKTVRSWVREGGYANRNELEKLFSGCGLPHPKDVLDALGLLRVVSYAEISRRHVSRDGLAEQFGFSSGDYLGKHATARAHMPLQHLVALGVEGAIPILVHTLLGASSACPARQGRRDTRRNG